MVEQIARRIINRIRGEISAFIDESGDSEIDASGRESSGDILTEVQSHLGKLIAEHHQTTKQLNASRTELNAMQQKIELAIEAGRDDLARAALIRRNGLNRQITSLEAHLKDVETESLELEDLIRELADSEPESIGDSRATMSAALAQQLSELDALVKNKTAASDEPKT